MKQIHHVLSAEQLADKELLEELFAKAESLRAESKPNDSLRGKILASLFYEPSTRTRFSFEAAMLRLGGGVISAPEAAVSSSAKKGETLEDTIRVTSAYADCIVLRHSEKGAALRAAEAASVPVLNAGDGAGEHPTQALLDVYTIQRELGKIDGLTIVLAGDLLHSRTMHSLVRLLGAYSGIRLLLVSPPELRIEKKYKHNMSVEETSDFLSALSRAHVLYMNRIQVERFGNKKTPGSPYILNKETIRHVPEDAIILDPLPRVDEIAPGIDTDPRAAYFRQAANGLYARMALLKHLFT